MRNPTIIQGDTAIIVLTKGKTTLVDAADLPILASYKWCFRRGRLCIYLHPSDQWNARQTIPAPIPAWPHRSNRPRRPRKWGRLDNRRANLRRASPEQNNQNQRLSSRNTSGYKGVSLFRRDGSYRASIAAKGKRKALARSHPDVASQGLLSRFKAVLAKAQWIVDPLLPAPTPRASVGQYRTIAAEAASLAAAPVSTTTAAR